MSGRSPAAEPPATRPRPARASLIAATPAVLVALLALLMLSSLTIGRYPVPLARVARIVATTLPLVSSGDPHDAPWVVVEIIRMPRILLVTLCGAGLALSGAALQGVFRNPLVGPQIVGISEGASLGGVVAIMLSLPALATVGLAFAAGLLALVAAFVLARVAGGASRLALVLSGVVVGSFCAAIVGLLQSLADPADKLPSIVFWLLGSFADATYAKVALVAGVTLVAGTLVLALRWRINLLSLGEIDARALGVDVERLRWGLLGLVTLIVAAQVSVSGGVGWVGLVVPHLARALVGPDHARLLPTSALLGALYLLAIDDAARGLGAQEIPIGFLTSVIGTPVFALLFWRSQSTGWTDE